MSIFRGATRDIIGAMARLILLVSFALVAGARAVFARQLADSKDHVVYLNSQAQDTSPSCPGTGADEQASVTVDEYKLEAKFVCSNTLPNLLPAYGGSPIDKCHNEPNCQGNGVDISAAFGIKKGTLTKGADPNNNYTLSLSSMPSNREKKIYYKCTSSGSENCTVTINLPKAPESNYCTLSKTVHMTVEQAGKAEFVCPSSTGFQPEIGKVYKAADGVATDELTKVLPGAELTAREETKTYTLNVPTLPSTAQTVYFKCTYSKPDGYDDSLKSADCVVEVAVNAAPAGGNTTSTTPTTTSGSASVAAALSALAVTAAFIANTLNMY